MINMENYKFNAREDYKKVLLDTLDNELEVFDPICDGAVEISEGMAYLREEVDKFFNKNKNFDLNNIEGEIIEHLKKKERHLGMSSTQRIGYNDGISILKDVFDIIREQKIIYEEEMSL